MGMKSSKWTVDHGLTSGLTEMEGWKLALNEVSPRNISSPRTKHLGPSDFHAPTGAEAECWIIVVLRRKRQTHSSSRALKLCTTTLDQPDHGFVKLSFG